ncbi:hypothetical protein AAHA92_21325 [Salvia divinorum]|uniref:Uncharacterized protein n=1 Tax=Salvia divinorum TaxID=28513 RepID=A0ABD1GMW6_SALDI
MGGEDWQDSEPHAPHVARWHSAVTPERQRITNLKGVFALAFRVKKERGHLFLICKTNPLYALSSSEVKSLRFPQVVSATSKVIHSKLQLDNQKSAYLEIKTSLTSLRGKALQLNRVTRLRGTKKSPGCSCITVNEKCKKRKRTQIVLPYSMMGRVHTQLGSLEPFVTEDVNTSRVVLAL